jgi:hypothetical protein
MDASGSFRHVGSAGRSCGGQTETEDRSSASVRSPLLRVVGKLGNHHGECICACRSFKILGISSNLSAHSGFNLRGSPSKINPEPIGTGSL